jgi:hypothetical protein
VQAAVLAPELDSVAIVHRLDLPRDWANAPVRRKKGRVAACRQLTLEPYKDKEKASVLRYIASAYTDPKLDLETVVEGRCANR